MVTTKKKVSHCRCLIRRYEHFSTYSGVPWQDLVAVKCVRRLFPRERKGHRRIPTSGFNVSSLKPYFGPTHILKNKNLNVYSR